MNRTASLLLALLVIITGFPRAVSAVPRQVDPGLPVDLAAMALTGADIERVPRIWRGAGDYRLSFSETLFPEGYIAYAALLKEVPEEEIREQIEAASLVRAYYTYFSPQVTAAGDNDRTVSSYVIEFQDADGAAAAWRVIQDESAMAHATDVDGLGEFGNASEGTLETGVYPETGDPYAQLDTTVLLGRFHLGVTIVDWHGVEPAIGYAHLLTRLLLARAEPVIATSEPGLSNQVLRLRGDSVSTYADAYTWLNGEARPVYGQEWNEADIRAWSTQSGAEDEFAVWQHLLPEDSGSGFKLDLYVTVTRFADAAAAAAWMIDHLNGITSSEAFGDVEVTDLSGDRFGANAFLYETTYAGRGTSYSSLLFQHGQIALRLTIESSEPGLPATIILPELAALQQTCLEPGGCLEPVDIPAALAAFAGEIP